MTEVIKIGCYCLGTMLGCFLYDLIFKHKAKRKASYYVNEYAKTIIQDLLDNTDEYARQKAEDFLKE